MDQVFIAVKDKFVEAMLVKKIWKLLVEIYYKIFADPCADWELFIRKLIEIKKSNLKLKKCFNFLFIQNPGSKIYSYLNSETLVKTFSAVLRKK